MNVIMKWKSNTIMNMEVATMTSQQDQKDEKSNCWRWKTN